MTKPQAHKKSLYARRLAFTRQYALTAEDRVWLDIASIGHEFGSSDFERLAGAKTGKFNTYRFGAGRPKYRPRAAVDITKAEIIDTAKGVMATYADVLAALAKR